MNNKQNNIEQTEIHKEYTLWRERKNVFAVQNKIIASGAQIHGNEYSAYAGAASFLGTLVLACAVIHFLFIPIIPLILDALPLNFGFDVWNGTYYGDPTVVFILDSLKKSIGFIIIIAAGLLGGRLPKKLLFTPKMRSRAALFAAIPAALSLGALYIVAVELTGGVLVPPAHDIPLFPQIFLSVFIIPILSELAYRGVLLFIFRQYGDLAAIITVSIAAALLKFDARLIPATLLVSAVLCYFSLMAENVIVPMLMHLVMNGVILLYSETSDHGGGRLYLLLLLAFCFAAGVTATVYLLLKHADTVETETTKDPLRSADKLFCMFTSVPVICAISAIVVASLF
jgi:hypothetical protein